MKQPMTARGDPQRDTKAQSLETNPKRDESKAQAKPTFTQERRSIPLCHTCGKPGYARDCPNHPPWEKICDK